MNILTFQKLVAGIAALPGGLKSKLGGLGSHSAREMSQNVMIYFMFIIKAVIEPSLLNFLLYKICQLFGGFIIFTQIFF